MGQGLGVKVREKNTSTSRVGVEERGGGRFEKGRSGWKGLGCDGEDGEGEGGEVFICE